MKPLCTAAFMAATLAVAVLTCSNRSVFLNGRAAAEEPEDTSGRAGLVDLPGTVQEARGRARVLHEAIHGALQVMHRDFFREDEGLTIPSKSLEDVFRELSRSHSVELRWLAVNTAPMNVEHKPRNEFEKAAVRSLASGEPEFESTADGIYRRAGTIRLSSTCLKCHVPFRTSTEDRLAGLVISIPLKKQSKQHSPR